MKPDEVKIIFKLNHYESHILSAIILNEILSAGEIAKITRVPRCRVYDVCETLRIKGLIVILEKEAKMQCRTKIEKEFIPTRYKAKKIKEMRKSLFDIIDLKANEEKDYIDRMLGIVGGIK